MHTRLDCIPCLARQTLAAARSITDDAFIHEQALRAMLSLASDMDLSQSPPQLAQSVHRQLREITGVTDPYAAAKQQFNGMALDMLPELATRVATDLDPFAFALRLAIAGNVIDLGVNGGLTETEARAALDNALHEPFLGDVAALRRNVDRARRILYLADNAGEIVFDRLFVDQLPADRVTVVVRGAPIINDATLADAQAVGLTDRVCVVDNGSDAPGTVLSDCSGEFRRLFAAADLILAKGQGNYETLSEEARNIWFLLKIKCPVVATRIGAPVGTHVALNQNQLPQTIP